MNWDYEKAVNRFEREAKSVLKSNGLPTSALKLKEKACQARDRLVLNAMIVVLGAHYLKKEIENNRIHQALNRFFSICDAYEQMEIYLNAESFDKKNPIISSDYIKSLSEGKASVENRKIAASARKSETQTKKKMYQKFVNDHAVKIKNPTWIKLQELAAEHFNVTTRTIRKHTSNPYSNC